MVLDRGGRAAGRDRRGGRADRRHPPAGPGRALAWAPDERPDAGPLAGPQWPGRDPRARAGRQAADPRRLGRPGIRGPGQAAAPARHCPPAGPRAGRARIRRPRRARPGAAGMARAGLRRTGLSGQPAVPAGPRGSNSAASAYGATLGGGAAIQPAPSGVAAPVSASLTARSAPFRAGLRLRHPARRGAAPGAPRAAAAGRPAHRSLSVTQVRSRSPMYSLSGRISRLSACCSMTWAVHPAIRLTENTGVNRSVGMPR